ncbi:Eukaryotic translation initiation factor 3 subunit M [Hondaea fermentalgiana]|uniref:Eukaryotic translation initiation factor 3 subunit M n=1 Tax=Hondaea fermentalgiana TaxID=2315210 RepID=A0A2R5G6W2_9STRA|nr:Eukaryotic translation initiation factor 3 subunit M [Hondaea fermentalgiana]|eukprot:GBG24193.1 Eukaryotic translation initiation factor 3 subunit M [Hondaea fermentalgiana]
MEVDQGSAGDGAATSTSTTTATRDGASVSAGFGGSNDYVEQFKILAKTTSGRATVAILEKVMNHKQIYVFGEILELERVQMLRGTEFEGALRALEIMAYGTLGDYEAEQSSLPALSEVQQRKLRMLTLVSLASKQKSLPYATVRTALRMQSDREVEDVVIESMYAGLLRARLYHRERLVVVHWAMGRDLRDEDLDAVAEKLSAWCENAEVVLGTLQKSIAHVQSTRASESSERKDLSLFVAQMVCDGQKRS